MPAERGKYIVFEGGDAVGKSTTLYLVADAIRKEFNTEVYTLEEPGGVRNDTGEELQPLMEDLRTIIKAKEIERSADMNVALFNFSRRTNWYEVMEPALKAGKWVVGARNWWSTAVYQGLGEGANADEIREKVLAEPRPRLHS
jgi:dTMP kinase